MMLRPAIHTRWMVPRDFKAVMEIETECFEFPWSESELARHIKQRNVQKIVAEWGNEVLGYMTYEFQAGRFHITSLAVALDNQRFGVGTVLVCRLIDFLSPGNRDRITLEVRERNLGAQLFFKGLGFRAISILKDFYDDSTEDAYLFHYRHEEAVPSAACGRGLSIESRLL